jgi:ubiquinone/menaquinone biosynthesis C-methylase UbiE
MKPAKPSQDVFSPDTDLRTYRQFRRLVRGHSAKSLATLYDSQVYECHIGDKDVSRLYFEHDGLAPTMYTERPIELLGVEPGDRILDVGCGRGEVVLQSAALGADIVGVDYAESAIEIAAKTLERARARLEGSAEFLLVNAETLPFADGSFDKVFVLDVIEHLSREEADQVLSEIRRVLRPRGVLLVHTAPNIWRNTVGHALHVSARLAGGRRPPVHPVVEQFRRLREDPAYDPRKIFAHVNEQSVWSLKLALRRAGYSSHVWLDHTSDVWAERPGLRNSVTSGAYRALGLKYFFGSMLFALASPRDEGHGIA